MKCQKCNSDMLVQKSMCTISEFYLKHLSLTNPVSYKCAICDDACTPLSDMESVQKLVVKELLAKPGLLTGEEIRFLRETAKTETWAFANTLPIERAKLRRIEDGTENNDHRLDLRMRFYFIKQFEIWGWVEKSIKFYEQLFAGLGSASISSNSRVNPLAIEIDLSNNSVRSALTIA